MKKDAPFIDFFPTEQRPPRRTHDWVEEALDMEASDAQTLGISHTRLYVGTIMRGKRVKYIFLAMLLGIFALWSRTSYLQIVRGKELAERAEGNRLRAIPIVAERGIIYDRFNHELVHNVPSFSLSIFPQGLPNPVSQANERAAILKRLSEVTGLPAEEITKEFERAQGSTYQTLTIKENLDYHTALALYLENNDLPGILINTGSRRWYGALPSSTAPTSSPQKNSSSTTNAPLSSLSHIIGYTGKLNDAEWNEYKRKDYLQTDRLGKTGIEKTYEAYLRGTYGKKIIEVDALGREQTTISVEPPTPGKNVTLTIDLEAQKVLEEALRQALEKNKKTRGSAIALNPSNGEVLALVSYPSFNNNDFSGGISSSTYDSYVLNPDRPLFNRAIGGSFPPGSTLKPVVAAAALEEKIVTPQTSFLSNGGIKVDRWFFPDWKAGGHGITNVTKALAWSVNTFFYYVGGGYQDFKGLGARKVLEYLTRFGLGAKTGIDLPGENSGFIPSPEWKEERKKEPWYVGDTYNISIGQGDTLVTPLQVAEWTSIVANGGHHITPHLLEKIVDPISKKTTVFPLEKSTSTIVTPATITTVRQGMRECVTYGSCGLLRSLPFAAAGKTGTAQWSRTKDTHAWFAAFAPYYNPQITVVVLLEEGGEGSVASQPVAQQFLSWWGKKYLTP